MVNIILNLGIYIQKALELFFGGNKSWTPLKPKESKQWSFHVVSLYLQIQNRLKRDPKFRPFSAFYKQILVSSCFSSILVAIWKNHLERRKKSEIVANKNYGQHFWEAKKKIGNMLFCPPPNLLIEIVPFVFLNVFIPNMCQCILSSDIFPILHMSKLVESILYTI